MNRIVQTQSDARLWPDPWQMVLIAICALILCSCRAPMGGTCPDSSEVERADSLPPEAYTGVPAGRAAACPPMGPPGMEAGVPLPYSPRGPWAPPGIRQPWPADEYVRDGGDENRPAGVVDQGAVVGVDMEDTVARYNTVDGQTHVQPSNEVYLYAPRFGAVRQVVGLVASEERQRVGDVHKPVKASAPTTLQLVTGMKQDVQPGNQIAARPPVALRMKQGEGAMSSAIGPRAFQDRFKAYENLAVIRIGVFEEAEMPFLANSAKAAIAWSHVDSVQVMLDRRGAMAEVKYDKALSVYTVCEPPDRPRLQLVKVASTAFAQPGDTVDFTIRFDNLGSYPIKNVTIIDSLSPRLEYVEKSAQCSRDATFSTAPNEGDSVALQCQLKEPLQSGQGGILRFRCRVR